MSQDHALDWDDIRRRLDRGISTPETSPERTREILDQRARRLARPLPMAETGDFLETLTFALGPGRYAIEHKYVREVVRFVAVTAVPGTPPHVAGVTNHRGQVLCLFDLRGFLRLPSMPLNDLAHIIVIGRGFAEFGMLADRTMDTCRLAVADMLELDHPHGAEKTLYRGVMRDGLIVLDGAALLRDPRLIIGYES